MGRGSLRTRFTGSALIRLLVQLTDADAPEPKQAFAERLSQWLAWTDAISLSAALNARPEAAPARRPGTGASIDAQESDFRRVKAALASAITDDRTPVDAASDFSSHRRRYVARQQAMEAGIGPLRERLRAALAAASPAMARLAAVDAVMDQVLGEQEHLLLSTVPRLLEMRFERLRQDDPDSWARPGGGFEVFGKDMQAVLLAELEIRLQPAEGLLEALRKRQASRHE